MPFVVNHTARLSVDRPLFFCDITSQLLYSRHEVQDISSVGYVKDDGMFVLLLKCWQAPGLRFLALAINCRKKVSSTVHEGRFLKYFSLYDYAPCVSLLECTEEHVYST